MSNDKDSKSAPNDWARYSQVAFIIPGAVVAGLIVGALIDKWLHTHWVYIAGVIVGAVAGFIQLIRTLTSASDKN
jgi:F0F1-type ATP synthase assembly protein I